MRFIFTHMHVSKDLYGVDMAKVEGMEGLDYQILPTHLGLAWGVIGHALTNYEIMVGGSWDTLPEALETIFYFILCRIRGKSFILWREDWNWGESSTSGRLLKPFIRFIVKNSNAVLVPGSIHQQYFISLGASPDKIFIMPNVSNLDLPDDLESMVRKIKHSHGWEDKKIILYVGRLIKRKGVQYLINALNEIDNEEYVLMVVGEGEYQEDLEKLVREQDLTDKVLFQGKVANDQLAQYYSLCDVVVVPSITYGIGDPWVMVLNEAMLLKKPVIATTAVGAAQDMILDGKNGFIIPEKDVKALSNKLDLILSDPKTVEEMGQKSYNIIKNRFQYPNMVDGFKKAVKYVLNK
jgi:glycosyltransferase involved in cell wall biosynthesis